VVVASSSRVRRAFFLFVAASTLLVGGLVGAGGADAAAVTPTVTGVSAGPDHACAVASDRTVWCWGGNAYGQLGDGTKTSSAKPVSVPGLADAVAVAVGTWHSCALTSGGAVVCWGRNSSGQLGNASFNGSLVPVSPTGLTSGVTAIAAAAGHSCALLASGGVQCWGENGTAQLGNDSLLKSSVPVDVSGLTGATAIATGDVHSCAVTPGGAQCWGSNRNAQLGDGTTKRAKTPVAVAGLGAPVTSIAVGSAHTCALTDAGAVLCWGLNTDGQVGDGTTKTRRVPSPVVGLSSGVTAITAGGAHSCAVTAAQAATCWGSNTSGELGSGGPTSWQPVAVVGQGTTTATISAGGTNTCAVTTDDAARCWGSNTVGQIGDGTRGQPAQRRVPMTVWGLTGSSGATYQPDLSVSARKRTGYVGAGVINVSGRKQTLTLRVARGAIGHAFVQVHATGGPADLVFLQGTGLGGRRSAVAAKAAIGRGDVTKALSTGLAWTKVPSVKAVTVSLTITVKATAALRAKTVMTVLSRSSHDPSNVDVTRVVVVVTR
jgi:alpha-tubulin suppressor-like RCC1 family protein